MSYTWTDPQGVPAGTMVVGWDGSRHAKAALAWAVDQAHGERRGITVAHTVSPSVAGEVAVWVDEDQRQVWAAQLHDEVAELLGAKASDVELHVLVAVGDPRSMLLELSQRAAMVVVGSHGRGPWRSKVLGSVGVSVVREAACPVVVVRPHEVGTVRRGVLAGLDVDDESALRIAEFAFHEASVLRLPLTVVHSVPEESSRVVVAEGRRELSAAIAGLREKYPDVHCTTVVQQGQPAQVILDQAERCHLTVMGAPRSARRHLTTTTSRVIEHSTNPVAVVPVRSEAAAAAPPPAGAR